MCKGEHPIFKCSRGTNIGQRCSTVVQKVDVEGRHAQALWETSRNEGERTFLWWFYGAFRAGMRHLYHLIGWVTEIPSPILILSHILVPFFFAFLLSLVTILSLFCAFFCTGLPPFLQFYFFSLFLAQIRKLFTSKNFSSCFYNYSQYSFTFFLISFLFFHSPPFALSSFFFL